jgi:disulfide bond formation protein DsbB
MSVDVMEMFSSLLALVALTGAVLTIVARFGAPRSAWASALSVEIHRLALWLAAAVATVATAGSLYFSEVADYVPCRLCWFQRICMYPLVAVLVVAAVRRDRSAKWYCLPLLVAGASVSTYHYLIEWKPSWGESACGIGPSCTDVWFREFGFVTLAFMALVGFVTIGTLLFVTPGRSGDRTGIGED